LFVDLFVVITKILISPLVHPHSGLEVNLFFSNPQKLYNKLSITVGCNNVIGRFNENLVTFREPKCQIFDGLKRCTLRNAVLRYNKKSGKSGSVAPKCKMAENLQSIDSHWPKIGLNPKFLGYSNSS
jgi:hypothetical protein